MIPGSALAQATWQVMSGQRVVALPVGNDERAGLLGCQVLEYLVRHGLHPRTFAWAVKDATTEIRMADYLAGYLVEADSGADLYIDWHPRSARMRVSNLCSDYPVHTLECRSFGPRYRRFIGSDLLVVEDRLLQTMLTCGVEVTAGQILLLGRGTPEPAWLNQVATGQLPGFWGDIPTELILAGAS